MEVSFAHHYRGLIALNSLGCRLMQLGSFLKAKESFSDAIVEVKHALGFVENMSSDESTTQPSFESSIDGKVKRAMNGVASSETKHTSFVQVLSQFVHGSSALTIPNWSDCGKKNQPHTFPIRLEVQESLESSSIMRRKPNLDLESAVVLHNMGTAFVSIAREESLEEQKNCLRHGAHVFQLAHNILRYFHERQDNSIELANTFLQVESTVLYSLIPVLRALDRDQEAHYYYGRLHHITSLLREYNDRMNCIMRNNSTAAAA